MRPLVLELARIVDEMNLSMDYVTKSNGVIEAVQAFVDLEESVREWKAQLLQLAADQNRAPTKATSQERAK